MQFLTSPVEWLTLDLETANGSPEDAEKYIRERWQPEALATWSEVTIGKRAKEALAAKKEKLSVLSASPILCASFKHPGGMACFHRLAHCHLTEVHGAPVAGYPDNMVAMLKGMRDWLDSIVGPDTVLVGHNIIQFDLPKLRWHYVRHNVRMPQCLVSHANVYDMMQAYVKKYAVGSSAMVALRVLLEEFGVESHKDIVSGADVQGLYESGDHDTIVKYALLDVDSESELYLRMIGRGQTQQ